MQAFQANPSRGRTHPVFVEVLRGRQELLQQGDHDDHENENDKSDEQMERFMLPENLQNLVKPWCPQKA